VPNTRTRTGAGTQTDTDAASDLGAYGQKALPCTVVLNDAVVGAPEIRVTVNSTQLEYPATARPPGKPDAIARSLQSWSGTTSKVLDGRGFRLRCRLGTSDELKRVYDQIGTSAGILAAKLCRCAFAPPGTGGR
jgi:hypothetical protein